MMLITKQLITSIKFQAFIDFNFFFLFCSANHNFWVFDLNFKCKITYLDLLILKNFFNQKLKTKPLNQFGLIKNSREGKKDWYISCENGYLKDKKLIVLYPKRRGE